MKKQNRVKVQTTPSGTYRVQKMVNGFRFSRNFAKKKEAVAFSKSFA